MLYVSDVKKELINFVVYCENVKVELMVLI